MQKYSRNKNVTEKNTNRKTRRIAYGIAAAVIAIGAFGGVAALEKPKPTYYAPDLQLIQGYTDYDLMAGIEYDEEKYVLSVEDTGSLDINKIGKYQVTYALTPIGETEETEETETLETVETAETETIETAETETIETSETETAETETKDPDGSSETQETETKESGDSSESPEVPGTEETKESTSESPEAPSNEESKESTSESPEAPSAEENTTDQGGALEEVTPENGDEAKAFANTILRSMFATVSAAEIESQETVAETPAESGNPAESESPEPTAPAETPNPGTENSNTENPGTETPGTETPGTENPGTETPGTENPGTETPGTETPGTETPGTETPGTETTETETPGTETPGTETSETETAETETSETETAETETAETEEPLGEAETFTRTVWVVAGADGFYIGYEEGDVKISASEPLYRIVRKEKEEETEQTQAQSLDAEETADVTEEEQPENPTPVEYELELSNPELLTQGMRATDDSVSLVPGATFAVTDDSALRDAVKVELKDGEPVIRNIQFGTYTIEITDTDPQTGKTASCTRTVTVEGISFDAPVLYIGACNTEYDLTADMSAVDENGSEAAVYVINEEELLAAKETVVDEETGEEREQFIMGTYHVTLGAKHPKTGKEYTVEREVEVVEGYYLYAPDLYVLAGTTDYDLTENVELRVADTEEVVEDAIIAVEDMTDLFRDMSEEEIAAFELTLPEKIVAVTGESTEGTENTEDAEETDEETLTMPPLSQGEYTVLLSGENPEDAGEPVTVQRTVLANVRATEELTMDFVATAYKDRLALETYKEGQVSRIGGSTADLDSSNMGKKLGLTSASSTNPDIFVLVNSGGRDFNAWVNKLPEPQESLMMRYHASYGSSGSGSKGVMDYFAKYTNGTSSLTAKIGGSLNYWDLLMIQNNFINYGKDSSRYNTIADGDIDYIYYAHGLDMDKFYHSGRKNTAYAELTPGAFFSVKRGDTIPGTSLTSLFDTGANVNRKMEYTVGSGGYNERIILDNTLQISLGNKTDWTGKQTLQKGDWNRYVNGTRETWEENDSSGEARYKAGDTKTLRNGWNPDVTLTPFKTVDSQILNIEGMENIVINITPDASILVDGTGHNFNLPYGTGSGTDGKPVVLPNMQYQLKGFQLQKSGTDAKVAYTLQNNSWFKLEDIKATTTAADQGNNWRTSGAGDLEFVANDGVNTINLYSENQKNVKLTQKGDHTGNTNAVTGFNQSLVLELTGTSNFLNLTSANTTEGTANTATLTLKGAAGIAKMTDSQGGLWDSGTSKGKIATGILDVQTTGAFTILKPAGLSDDQAVLTIYNKHLSNGKQILVGQADGTTFTDGEVIASGGTAGAKLDATDFDTDATNQAAFIYPMNRDEYTVIAKKLTTKSILVQQNSSTLYQTDTYADAFNWLTTNGTGGTYTVKILVPRNYGQADQTALLAVPAAKASKIVLEASNGSGIDNGYMRMRVASELAVLELPTTVEVEFTNIAVRRSDAAGTTDEQVIFVNNGSALTISRNYKTVGDTADIYGGSSTGDSTAATTITVNAGIFQNVYGGSMENHSHSGNAVITIGAGAEVTTVDGASKGETTKPGGKNARMTLNGANIPNVYNYDKLTVEGSSTISGQLDSQKSGSYQGETLLNAGSTLTLSNSSGKRQMGSLKLAESAAGGAAFQYEKPVGTVSATNNDYLVTLTASQPVTAFQNQTNKITVSYTNNTKPTAGDIVFYLPNAGNTAANVHTRAFTDGFGGVDGQGKECRMVPNAGNNTIVMRNVSVGLITGNDNKVESFMTLADLINDSQKGMKKQEQDNPNQNYTITFFADGYGFTQEDFEAVNDMLNHATVQQITWASKIDANGGELAVPNTVYGMEGQVSLFGTAIVLKDITFSSNTDLDIFVEGVPVTVETGVSSKGTGKTNLYGGGKEKATTVSTIVIKSGNFGTIYGGGIKAQNGDATITMSGGTADAIYGGGNGADGTLTGNTSITVNGGDLTNGKIYGGGKAAAVKGTSKVTYVVQNTSAAKTDILDTISGSGTDAAGALADNVTGDKAVTLTGASRNHTVGMVLTNLAGFDTLDLGTTGGIATSYERGILRVLGRLDSKAVDDGKNDRTATLTLHSGTLVTGDQVQGHIGQLIADGECMLVVAKKSDGSTLPLMVDKKENDIKLADKLKLAVLSSNDTSRLDLKNRVGDRLIQFTSLNVDSEEYKKYEDGLSTRLAVKQLEDNGATYIKFDMRQSHIAGGWVEYTDNVPDSTTAGKKPKKLHILYDKDNEHEIRTNYAAGYIVALPKNLVNQAAAADYVTTDTQFIANGTFSAAVQALNPYTVTAVIDQSTVGANGKHQATAEVSIPDLNPADNWYILHIMCEDGDTMTTVLDVDAPIKAEADVKMEFDSKNQNYVYELHLADKDYGDKTELPTLNPGAANADDTRLTYTANGVTAAYWTVGNLAGTDITAADAEVVKRQALISAQPGTNGLYDTAKVVLLADGASAVPGGATAKVTVTVPKAVVDAHKDNQDAIWVYAKDGANNTVKIAIPLSDNIIDVTVPLAVNVIAVKKTEPGAATELLAPTCEVINNGSKAVEVQIAGFQTTVTQDKLKLSPKDKSESFNADELSLFIKGAGATTMAETNVTTLDAKPLTLGTLGKAGEADSTAWYTFDAGYHVNNINIPDGYIKNTMSYRFRIVGGN